jgi:hypothetical protein
MGRVNWQVYVTAFVALKVQYTIHFEDMKFDPRFHCCDCTVCLSQLSKTARDGDGHLKRSSLCATKKWVILRPSWPPRPSTMLLARGPAQR